MINKRIKETSELIEERLHRNNVDVFHIADEVGDGLYVIDAEGIVMAVNAYYTEITGFQAEEVLGRSMRDVWNENIFDLSRSFLVVEDTSVNDVEDILNKTEGRQYLASDAKPVSLMAMETRKKVSVIANLQGTERLVLIVAIPFFNEDLSLSRVYTLIRDLTQMQSLRQQLVSAEEERNKYLNEVKYLRESLGKSEFVGNSYKTERLKAMIASVAPTDATVLITGETGVGKEVVAREIYEKSGRRKGPYIKVNCAAIPDSLLEAELFGYVKGAFTGSGPKDKPGLFEMADQGTILLDEIGEMPLMLQSKLLRVLQEREVKRLGASTYKKLDVRVIAATNQNLKAQVKAGRFREDLYYRLNVIPIEIPPLRERPEDIQALALYFKNRFNERYKKQKQFEKDALKLMGSYTWPGNIRELENVIERLIIVGDQNEIRLGDLENILGFSLPSEKEPLTDEGASPGETIEVSLTSGHLKDAVKVLETQMLLKALKEQGSSYKAAKVLGLNQSTVVRKAQSLGIHHLIEK